MTVGQPGRHLRPPHWRGVRRVLAVRLDNIGDVVLLSPALRAVRAALPDATLTLLASPAGAQAAPLLPEVDDVIVHRALWQDASGALPFDPAREQAFVTRLTAGRYDAALIFTSWAQSPYPAAFAAYLAGIPIRVGATHAFGGGVLSHVVTPPPDRGHQADRNLHLVVEAGLPPAGTALALRVPPAADTAATALLAARGIDPHSPFVVLAPGASCATRRYPAAGWAAAAAMIADGTRWPVVAVGSEAERALCDEVAPLSLAGETTVPELAAVIARARLLLGNNSGPMHLADALRVPMVIAYSGAEDESQFSPRSAGARLLRRATPCSPCRAFECPYGLECLAFPPDEIAASALSLLTRA
jgi:ADP-heptose:LPS heptosyltransferase